MNVARVQFGIKDLDKMICGGLLEGSANLLEGAPGTGKTTLAMQFIYNGIVKYDQPGLIITFEEFPQQYYHDALQFGWDLKKLEDEGKLKVIFSDPYTTLDEFDRMDGELVSIVEEMGTKRVIVDSMTHFESLTDDQHDLREIERRFINALKRENVTSILLRENNNLLGQVSQVSSKIPFIVDSYIILRYVEVDSAIEKALCFLKMRGSDHQKDIRCFKITSKGIEVESKFNGREGILSGFTHSTPQDAFVNVFGKK
ncbi:ATPase domain-containing protein [Chitinispirillales bacterium ANBcel5]|uniref:RAD55 family ATPase n=1 Tax=Cellulosispirillum alkaliphilum TaxID=3039283 RepID=UPI002A4E41A3|nr:ATPase domain-containing protein [Chitinispirillales bacterium ANBcel5]